MYALKLLKAQINVISLSIQMVGIYHHGCVGMWQHYQEQVKPAQPSHLRHQRPAQLVRGVRVQLHVPPQPPLPHYPDQPKEAAVPPDPGRLCADPVVLLSAGIYWYLCIQGAE